MRVFPESALGEINDALDPRRVLEFVAYKTDKIQDAGDTLRGFCPIHRENVFRTLVVNKERRSFKCMYGLCAGAEGGDLVRLVSLARGVSVNEAAHALVKEMGIEIRVPVNPDLLNKNAEVGENYLTLDYFDDAKRAFDEILESEPGFERAHEGLLKALIGLGDTDGQARTRQVLARLALQHKRPEAAVEHARELAALRQADPVARKLLAECCLEAGDTGAALDEFMYVADLCESAGDFDAAIEAYKRIEDLETDVVDINPHLLNAFQQSGRAADAVEHMTAKAERAAQRADFNTAAELLELLFDLDESRLDTRSRYVDFAVLAHPLETWSERVLETASWFLEHSESDRAIAALRQLLDQMPGSNDVMTRLHDAYMSAGREGEAASLRVEAARAQFETGERDAALQDLRQILDAFPGHEAALEALADLETQSEDFGAANTFLMRLAEVRRARNDYAGAAGALDRVLATEPDSVEVRIRRAEALEAWGATGDADAVALASLAWEEIGDLHSDATSGLTATRYFERALPLGPRRPELLSKLARSRYRAGERDPVREAVREACGLLVAGGRRDEAVAEAAYFAEMMPDDAVLSLLHADMVAGKGDTHKAAELLRTLATKLAGKDDVRGALSAVSKAVKLAPDSVSVLDTLAAIQERGGDSDALLETLDRLAAVHQSAGGFADATAVLERRLAASPDHAPTVRRLAELADAAGMPGEALRWLGVLARIHRGGGDHEAEAGVLGEALQRNPDDDELLSLLTACELARDRSDEACVLARRHAALHTTAGDTVRARAVLASILESVPNDLETLRDLFAALARPPESGDLVPIGVRLVNLYLVQGRKDAAMAVYDEIVELRPNEGHLRHDQVDFLARIGETESAGEKLLALAAWHADRAEYGEAERMLQDALVPDPRSVALRRALVRVLEQAGDLPRRDEQLRELAEAHLAGGDAAAALATVDEVLVSNPESVDARRQRVRYLRELGRIEEAVVELVTVAEALTAAGDLAGAVEADRAAALASPSDLSVRRRLITQLLAAGQADEADDEAEDLANHLISTARNDDALDTLNDLLDRSPVRLSALRTRAELFSRMGDDERARAEFRIVTGRTRLQQARANREAGEHDKEARDLREALAQIPDDPEILYELVTCEFLRGENAAACAVSRQLAEVQWKQGQGADARATLAGALDRAPDDIETVRDLFHLLRAGGFTEEAVTRGLHLVDLLQAADQGGDAVGVYEDLVGTDPDNLRLKLNQIELLRRLGRGPEAIAKQFALALIHRAQGRVDDCELVLLQVLAADETHLRAREELVAVYEDGGHPEKAAGQMRQLADLYEQAGDTEKAVSAMVRVLDVEPSSVEARRQFIGILRARDRSDDALRELHALADVLRGTGDEPGALAAETDAVGICPGVLPARRRLVDSLVKAGEITRAIPELEQLADLQAEGGEAEAALATLEEILGHVPDRPSALVKRAEIFTSLGQQDRALEEYRKMAANVAAGAPSQPIGGASLPPADGFLQIVREYDFDHFIVGTHNNFACATSRAVASAPARAYNPLFLYSDVGLGKTHLVNAIANFILKQDPKARIIYTNSEDFTGELVNAIQTNAINAFRARYKTLDLLIVDDVQFLAGKERAQEEFFHIFNALFQAKRQIVVTSDRPPKDIAHLEGRLRSRFGAGVIVDIAAPDYETRLAILRTEIANNGLGIDDSIAAMLAERVSSNVRELKGALNQVVAMRVIMGTEPNEDSVRRMLDNLYAAV